MCINRICARVCIYTIYDYCTVRYGPLHTLYVVSILHTVYRRSGDATLCFYLMTIGVCVCYASVRTAIKLEKYNIFIQFFLLAHLPRPSRCPLCSGGGGDGGSHGTRNSVGTGIATIAISTYAHSRTYIVHMQYNNVCIHVVHRLVTIVRQANIGSGHHRCFSSATCVGRERERESDNTMLLVVYMCRVVVRVFRQHHILYPLCIFLSIV